jgi:thiol-disulfide isomerase/thioredoxin
MRTWKYLKIPALIGIFTSLFFILSLPMRAGNSISIASANVLGRDSLSVGSEAPPFVMRNLVTDNAVFLRDYTGKTLREPWKKKNRCVVVLSFWATWCEPCKTEIPLLEKLSEDLKSESVKFFLVNTMEKSEVNEDTIRQVYKSRSYKIPCLLDQATRFAQLYCVHGLPLLIVIDKFGIVRKINHGFDKNYDIELEKLLKELAKEDGASKK